MLNKLMISAAAGLALLTAPVAYADTGIFTAEQQKSIEKITHDYLVSHPQVLIEMATALQKQQQAQWQQTAKSVVPQIAKPLFSSNESPTAGNPNGDVALVEFFDYQCPHCKEMTSQVDELLKSDKNLKVIYKFLPIYGKVSEFAAKAGFAATKQGKFSAFHDALMAVQTAPLTEDIILKTAETAGLDLKQLQTDMKNPAFDEEIKQNDQLAKQLKLTGTPAFVVAQVSESHTVKNPVLVPGAVGNGVLAQAIAEARQSA